MTIQDAIAAADFTEESYYASTYRYAEPKYWLRIAGWITESALERRFVEQNPVTTVLDLGCGYGTLLAFATTSYAASVIDNNGKREAGDNSRGHTTTRRRE